MNSFVTKVAFEISYLELGPFRRRFAMGEVLEAVLLLFEQHEAAE